MAMGWDKSAGATGIVAALVFFVAIVVAISDGMAFGAESFEKFFTDSAFQALTAMAGAVTAVCGVLYGGKGTRNSSMSQCILGVALIIAGAVTIVLAYHGNIGLKWQAAFNSFAIIFVLTAIIAAVSDGLEGTRIATTIDVILLLVLAIAFIENKFLEGMLFPIVAMVLVLFIGIMCFVNRSNSSFYDAKSRNTGSKSKDKDKPVTKHKDKKAEPKFYETSPAAKPVAGTDAAKKDELSKVAPAKLVEPVKAAEQPAAPVEASVVPAKGLEKQESTPALPKMVSSHDADRAAAAARANRAKVVEESSVQPFVEPVKQESVSEPELSPTESAVAEAVPAEEELVQEPIAEPKVFVKESVATEPVKEELAEEEPVQEPAQIAPVEQPVAIEPAPVQMAVEGPAPQAAIESAKQPIAVAAPVEQLKIASQESVYIEESQPTEKLAESLEEDEFSPEELGLAPDTPETLVRRSCWNLGLRCRKDYGDRKIPVAFVKGNVAVYIDGEVPDHASDEGLKEEGWTVLHFALADISDGQAQAEVVAAAVKENVRSKKAAKRKGKR